MKVTVTRELVGIARDAKAELRRIYDENRTDHGSINWTKARVLEGIVVQRLTTAGFRIKNDSQGSAVSAGGLRATGTSGLMTALGNWLLRAEAATK